MTETEIEKLKAANPSVELFELKVGDESIVVKRPSRIVWKRFKSAVIEGGPKKVGAIETLVKDCAVHPTGSELEAAFDRRPALPEAIAEELGVLAGLPGGQSGVEKKAL